MMEIDTSTPNAGRIYDYYLGGNHNFGMDQQAVDHLLTLMPSAKFCTMWWNIAPNDDPADQGVSGDSW